MRNRNLLVITAIALVAIAVWPLLGARRAAAARPYVAPVLHDYARRDETVAFYERRVREDPQDQISARMLGAEYMQRYRETLDVGDLQRGMNQAFRSLRLQPQNNASAEEIIASGYYAMHDFRRALTFETRAHAEQPNDSNAPSQMALLEMEMGHYSAALRELKIARHLKDDPGVWAAQARYDEITGHLAEAIVLMNRAARRTDEVADNSAEARAWYHYRLGQMYFSSGRIAEAENQEHIAVTDFPGFEMGWRALARFCWGVKDWKCAQNAGQNGASIIPEPETLGYLADAQRALGHPGAAERTQELIFAVERIGNAYRINDRLLSVYYSEHGVRLADSLTIAVREAHRRGDAEVHAEDTLAWAAAMDGRWSQAYRAMRIATRFHTQDPRVLFHAGMIEYHFRHLARARGFLSQALTLNAQFDPFYAGVARETLRMISRERQSALESEGGTHAGETVRRSAVTRHAENRSTRLNREQLVGIEWKLESRNTVEPVLVSQLRSPSFSYSGSTEYSQRPISAYCRISSAACGSA